MNTGMIDKPRRRFTRGIVVLNCTIAWCMVGYAIHQGEGVAGIVVPAALTLIAWLVGGYMGVGAVDFRTATSSVRTPAPAVATGSAP